MHDLLRVLLNSVLAGLLMVGVMFFALFLKNGAVVLDRRTLLFSLIIFLLFALVRFFSTPPIPSLIKDFRTRALDRASLKITIWKVRRGIESSRRAERKDG